MEGVLWCTSTEGVCYACAPQPVTTLATPASPLKSQKDALLPSSLSRITPSPSLSSTPLDHPHIPNEMFFSCIDSGEHQAALSMPVTEAASSAPSNENINASRSAFIADSETVPLPDSRALEWMRVIPPVDLQTGNAETIVSVAVAPGYAWAVTR